MTSISPFGNRLYNTSLTGTGQQPARADTYKKAAPIKVPDSGNVALSSKALDLQQRVAGLGNATVDLAQNLLGNFAGKMFGDAMKGATIDFDAVSLESTSTFAAGAMHTQGANGTTDAAAFSLTDSSHFLGKGTITLADGHKYDFEVEVQYDASLSAGAAATGGDQKAEQKPTASMPTMEFPEIDWAGGLSDLFALMDKKMSADVKQNDSKETLGTLSARLLKLVNSEQSLDTYGPPTTAHVKNAASAYAAGIANAPIKDGPVRAPAPDPVVDTQTDETVRAPAPEPVVDTQTQPVRAGGAIPLTISTAPPPDDAA